MNTLAIADPSTTASSELSPVQWPQLGADELYASSLNAYPQAVRHWCAGFGIEVEAAALTADDGLLIELEWRTGHLMLWLENHGSPFLSTLCQGNELPSPDWLTACLLSLWTGNQLETNKLHVLKAHKAQRPALCEQGWSFGAARFGFVACDETTHHEFTKDFRSPQHLSGIGITTTLIVPVGYQPAHELQSLQAGDAIVLAPDLGTPIAAHWAWGLNRMVAATVNVNLQTKIMVFDGEIRNMEATIQDQFTDRVGSVLDLSGLEIPISFEIETGIFPLQQMQSLAPGQQIHLRTDPSHCKVRLLAAGQCVASGRLVQIGNALAVHLEQVNGSGAQA